MGRRHTEQFAGTHPTKVAPSRDAKSEAAGGFEGITQSITPLLQLRAEHAEERRLVATG